MTQATHASTAADRRRIGVVGTFDVENYGDLLLANIARHHLGADDVEVVAFSPVGGPAVWADSMPSSPTRHLLLERSAPDGVVVGGGNIITARRTRLHRYRRGGYDPLVAYSELWRLPGYLSEQTGAPSVWNAPGVPTPPDPRVAGLLARMAGQAAYVSVRDAASADNLRQAGFGGQLSIVPDTGVQTALLWDHADLKGCHAEMLARSGLPADAPTVCINLNDRYVQAAPSQVARWIEGVATAAQAVPLLIATGPCHGDDRLVAAIGAELAVPAAILSAPSSLREVTAAIGMSRCFVGSSLHGVVVAASFGRPAVPVGKTGTTARVKIEGFLTQFGISGPFADTFAEAVTLVPAALAEAGRWATVPDAASLVLADHWASIRTALGQAGSPVEGAGPTRQADDTLQVVAYNVQDMAEGFDAQHAAMRAQLREVGAQVLTLQKAVSAAEQRTAAAEQEAAAHDRVAKALQKAEVAVSTLSRQRDEAVRRHDALRSARSVRLVLPVATALRGAFGAVRGDRGAGAAPPALGEGSGADRQRAPRRPQGDPLPVEVENRRLKQDVMHLRAELADLRARRSVKAAMRAAEVLRPVHDIFTSRAGLRDVMGRSRGSTAAIGPVRTSAPRPPWTHHDFEPTETGVFYDRLRALLNSEDVPEAFVHEWATSEEDLRETGRPEGAQDQPLVSIVMPTWNRGAIIGEAIASITDQTYGNWQLLIGDDGSEDDTAAVVRAIGDDRILYDHLPKAGAAAARNHGLEKAEGELIAYLDTDNLWHPRYLETMVAALAANPGRYAAYAKYVDVFDRQAGITIKKYPSLPFDFERLTTKNFIDLNSVVQRRALYDRLGGFDEQLPRQQDWDLLIKYSFLRDPLYVDHFLTLYRRNEAWNQITDVQRQTTWTVDAIKERLDGYYTRGLPVRTAPTPPRMTIVSWDVCRNHFSKAYNLAECLDDPDRVHLLGFRFFDEPVFPPYADAQPAFRTTYLDGGELPGWGRSLARAVAAVDGEVVYAVKPRLPSLGVALLANHLNGTPVVLEMNDLESVVTTPRSGQRSTTLSFADVDPADPDLANPYGDTWTALMEGVAARIPHRVTHNRNLDDYFGGGAHIVRNLKDETWFDPSRWDRDAIRAELGFGPGERVLLFGGMVRKHKGVFQFAELLEKAGPQYRLLVVGSRTTPDQRRLADTAGDRVTILPPAGRNEMARINMASDAVVLWLDPAVPASHYQMPYKLTDALAMRVPVIANDISDLGDLGREGYLTLVPHGDDRALVEALHAIEADPERTRAMVDRGRRLYLRQFSYRAARTNLGMILEEARATHGVLDVAEEFAGFLSKVREAQGVDQRDVMS